MKPTIRLKELKMPEKIKMVKLSTKVWRLAKHAAIDSGVPLTLWVEDAILQKLEQSKGEKK
jgi:hypothetical protein